MTCPGDVASKAYVDSKFNELKALLDKKTNNNDFVKKSDTNWIKENWLLLLGGSYATNSFVQQVNKTATSAWSWSKSANDLAQSAENYAKNAANKSYEALLKAQEAKNAADLAKGLSKQAKTASDVATTTATTAKGLALSATALLGILSVAVSTIQSVIVTLATKRELDRVWKEFDNQEAARQRDFNLLNNILMRLKSEVNTISSKAETAINKANNAISKATMAINNANAAMNEASKAMTRAGLALTKANLAINKAGTALITAISASTTATNAYNLITSTKSELISKINQLANQITNIRTEINNFVTTVKSNLAELKTYIDSLKAKINQLENTIKSLENIIKSFNLDLIRQSILRLDNQKTDKATTNAIAKNTYTRISNADIKATKATNKANDASDLADNAYRQSEFTKNTLRKSTERINNQFKDVEKMNNQQYTNISTKLDKITNNTTINNTTNIVNPEIKQKLDQLQKNDENILSKVGKLALPIVAIKIGVDGILKGINAIKNRQSPCEARIIPPIVNAQTVASQGVIMGGVGSNLAQTVALRTSWTTWLNGSWATFTSKFGQMFNNLVNPLRAANEVIQTGLMIHNAIMLSRDIGYTMGFILDNIQNALGMNWTSESGEQITISQAIGKSLKDRMIEMIGGQEKWKALNFEWFKWSTIYNAAANTIFTVTGMIQTVQSTIDLVGSFTGKIGNALKAASVVMDNAYNWLPDNIHTNTEGRFAKFFRAIDNVNDVSSTISNVTSDAVSVKDQFNYLKTIDDETKQAITDRENEILNADNESRLESEAPESLETANLDNYLE